MNTREQEKILRQLLVAGIEVVARSNMVAIRAGMTELAYLFTCRHQRLLVGSAVLVTARRPRPKLSEALSGQVG